MPASAPTSASFLIPVCKRAVLFNAHHAQLGRGALEGMRKPGTLRLAIGKQLPQLIEASFVFIGILPLVADVTLWLFDPAHSTVQIDFGNVTKTAPQVSDIPAVNFLFQRERKRLKGRWFRSLFKHS
jgi:hypothetical protein